VKEREAGAHRGGWWPGTGRPSISEVEGTGSAMRGRTERKEGQGGEPRYVGEKERSPQKTKEY